MYYFLKYCYGRVHDYGDNIVKHKSFFFYEEDEWSHKIIMESLCDRKAGLPKVRPGSGRPDSPGLSGRPARSVLLIYS